MKTVEWRPRRRGKLSLSRTDRADPRGRCTGWGALGTIAREGVSASLTTGIKL